MTGRRLSVRDYKGPRREGQSFGWLRPFALGLALGLAIAAAVFIQTRRHFLVTAAAGNASGNAERVATSSGSTTGAADPAAGAALPKFDFYQMLPRSQVLIPAHESETHLPAGAPLDRPGTYFLQIGSYRDAAVADRVRAQVEKLGVTVSVQRIVVDAATWHRVRVGPIRDLAVLNRVRHQLQAGNLQAMIVRVTP